MKESDRQFLDEGDRRFLSMLKRFSLVKEVLPWLGPVHSYASLRRTAARLRSGKIRASDPRIPPSALADVIEGAIAQEELVKLLAMDLIEYRQMSEELREIEEAERARDFVDGFHQLKKSAAASDPESPVAEEVRRIHRMRRSERGRPRKRKKKE